MTEAGKCKEPRELGLCDVYVRKVCMSACLYVCTYVVMYDVCMQRDEGQATLFLRVPSYIDSIIYPKSPHSNPYGPIL